jgi:hypothetical protein
MNLLRYESRTAVRVLTPNDGTVLFTEWISFRGAFLRTDSPPPPMRLVRMRFSLPPLNGVDRDVVLHGVVVRLAPPTRTRGAGVEISFFAKGGEEGRRWDAFVEETREASGVRERPTIAALTATPRASTA